MKQHIKVFLIVAILTGCSNESSKKEDQLVENAHAQHTEHEHAEMHSNGASPEKLELPEYLRNILRIEMQQVDSGMGNLLSFLAQGNVDKSVKVAEQLHSTFILKQQLSQQDLKQLISLLPADFIQLDREFHRNAKKIAEAVKQHDFETSIQLYSEMAQACVTCHTQYAFTRFPSLKNE